MTPRTHRLRRTLLILILALLGVAAYARFVEPFWLRVRTVRLPLAGLDPALEGYRIVFMSDLHRNGYVPLSLIERAVERANALQPDLIVLGGDYVRGRADAARELTPVLERLYAPHGVYAVLGNHDRWSDPDLIREALRQAGVRVLLNEGVTLAREGAPLYLAGLDDAWSGVPGLPAALAGAPRGAPIILAAHEPDLADRFIPQAAALGKPLALQLSGHSHGGQVRLPFIGAPVLPYLGRTYDLGLYRIEGAWLYVTSGVGYAGPPLRLGCRPEVVEIILTRE